MATDPFQEQARCVSEISMHQSILQQAQAAATAQIDPARPIGHEALLQHTDLVTSDVSEDDTPPPAYGDVYGEIRNEKDGLGTSARVTDDGRVNIRINQFNRRLSQIFTPALRQEFQNAQDSGLPLPPYVPPSLGGEEGNSPPPPLNIVIQVVGSRGDVQPFVALGKVLKDTYGHRVRLATHLLFKDFVQENGLEFFSIGGDPSRLMAFMVKNPGLMPGFRSLASGDVGQRRRDVGEYIQGCWRSCYEAGDRTSLRASDKDPSTLSRNDSNSELAAKPFVADCIIANPPSFAHIHCAEKLGIPLHIMFTMPYSPTQAFPHPLANIQSSNADPQLTNFISYAMIELLSWQGLGDIINRFRRKCLGLDPVGLLWAPGMLQRLKVPHTYCWSPNLIPKPKDWGPHISIAGFYLLKSPDYIPPPDLQTFLDAGPPPVYIGFGSIMLEDPEAVTNLIFETVKMTGHRVLLSKGWGRIGADYVPSGVFMLGNVPHEWLFKHVSCVVHHGGAGTTATGITAGRPTVVVPFFGDQPFWGAMVARAGAGPDPIPIKQLTADKLANAINFCLRPETLERARELASKIATERGTDMGAQLFHQHLEVDRLRCSLAPSRSAVWRIKRTKVKLSAFAACTLANANLLDFHDLKLFRPQEYYTDEGPWDPVSGGFTTALNAFTDMAIGLAETPSETWKAFRPASRSNRQESQSSLPIYTGNGKASDVESRSALKIPRKPIPTSLDLHQKLGRFHSSSSTSGLPSTTADVESSSTPDALQRQLSLETDDSQGPGTRNRDEKGSNKDRDMLRQTPHGSKGAGRFAKALMQSPMDLSVSFVQGFHNVPKLWGDDTVRPQERVKDFKSGMKAVGREFGLGWYDGLTGLVTQPWQGAQKEGTAGFFKGIGKGIGGFIAKPSAAMFGVLGHSMKGVHMEVLKLFGSNVENYIVASRVGQGYEEWLQSSDAEKQDVIARWKLIQKYLKKKRNNDEMMRDVLEEQRKMKIEDGQSFQNFVRTASFAQSTFNADASTQDSESVMESTGRDLEENAHLPGTTHENVSRHQRSRQKAVDHQAAQARPRNQRQRNSDSEYESSDVGLDDEEDEEFEWGREHSEKMAEKARATADELPHTQQYPPYDSGHLDGTTQDEFETQQQGRQGREKSAQEKKEEEIVMEYIKKQSLLEVHHQTKGKGKSRTDAHAVEDGHEEELQKALKLSMQEHRNQYGETSRR